MADNGRWAKADVWERELNGSMDGLPKSVAVMEREMGSASTVFGEGLFPVLVGGPTGSVCEARCPFS